MQNSASNATEQPDFILIDLTSDNEMEQTPSKLPAAAAAAATATSATSPSAQEVIDLSKESSTALDLHYQKYASSITNSLSKKKRKRDSSSREKGATQSPADAIDIDAITTTSSTTNTSKTPSDASVDSYKQLLGPLRMDFIADFQPSHFYKDMPQNPTLKTHKLFPELLEYKLNLPVQPSSSIFVRAMESRLDLLRIAITGPEGTPYAHGIFLFDCYLHDYPQSPPRMKFLTTGGGQIRFNPNLYQCGKICLSLLGTWSGPGWQPRKSTLLQVLISIQGLVLVPDPFFNEPAMNPSNPALKQQSDIYNRQIRQYTLKYAIHDALKHALAGDQYHEFAQVIQSHFAARENEIRTQIREWVNLDPTLRTLGQDVELLLVQLQERKSPVGIPGGKEVIECLM